MRRIEAIAFSHSRVGSDINAFTDTPHLSVIFSGTQDQATRLVKDVANGLTSRIAFVELPDQSEFRNPFVVTHEHAYVVARELSATVRDLWAFNSTCMKERSFEVCLNSEQQDKLVAHFRARFNDTIEEADKGTTLRAGIILVRLATILTCVRNWETKGSLDETMFVVDDDFETALALAEYFRQNTDSVIARLQAIRPNVALPKSKRRTQEWYTSLPAEFVTADAIALGVQFGIARSTVLTKLGDEGNFVRVQHGRYRKCLPKSARAP